jgi:hypothetical protein
MSILRNGKLYLAGYDLCSLEVLLVELLRVLSVLRTGLSTSLASCFALVAERVIVRYAITEATEMLEVSCSKNASKRLSVVERWIMSAYPHTWSQRFPKLLLSFFPLHSLLQLGFRLRVNILRLKHKSVL